MSIAEVEPGKEFEPVDHSVEDVVAEGGGALSERMAHRAKELEEQQTEWFPVPGWEDMIEVELKALGYRTIRASIERNKRIRDVGLRELYSLCDQIAKATVSFREVDGEKTKPVDDDWVKLARRLPDAPDEIDTRKAILFLVGEKRLHFLIEEWGNWARSVRHDVDREVAADFEATG